jgi:hypothetical protein
VTALEFNRIGEVSQIKSFSKDCYDDELRMHIENELMLNRELLDYDLNKKKMDMETAKKTVKSLKYSNEILVSPTGDLYRIASIVNDRFNDNVAVNLLDEDETEVSEADALNMGLFVVSSSTE